MSDRARARFAALMTDVFRLAADSMRGRRTGTPENAKARALMPAFYVAAARLVASFVNHFDANPVAKPK